MVVTLRAPTALTGVTHERTGSPARCTVQAPHRALPQPYFVPVSPSLSRSTHSSGMSPSTSTERSLPLTFSLIMNAAGGSPDRTIARAPSGRRKDPLECAHLE